LSVKDSQNSIAEIRDQLSKNQVHVRVFDQKAMEDKNDGELLVIFTKKSAEKNIQTAISSINKLPDVVQPAKLIRVDT